MRHFSWLAEGNACAGLQALPELLHVAAAVDALVLVLPSVADLNARVILFKVWIALRHALAGGWRGFELAEQVAARDAHVESSYLGHVVVLAGSEHLGRAVLIAGVVVDHVALLARLYTLVRGGVLPEELEREAALHALRLGGRVEPEVVLARSDRLCEAVRDARVVEQEVVADRDARVGLWRSVVEPVAVREALAHEVRVGLVVVQIRGRLEEVRRAVRVAALLVAVDERGARVHQLAQQANRSGGRVVEPALPC